MSGVQNEIRKAQGLTEPVAIQGEGGVTRSYVFKRLKRKEIHRVQYQLVSPVLRLIQGVIETMKTAKVAKKGKFSLEALERGDIDFEAFDVAPFADLIETIGFDRYWEIARAVLSGAYVDDLEIGDLDESEYFDDKPLEMIRALLAGVSINFPFVRSVIARAKRSIASKAAKKAKSASKASDG